MLAAAEELLAGGVSFADLSIERIATAAGRSRTAFYQYFRDKRDLLEQLTESAAAEFYDVADRWWSGGRGDLRRATTEIVFVYRRHDNLLRAVIEAATYDEEVGRFWRGIVNRFIVKTRERLEFDGASPEQAASKAFALVWMTERTCYEHFAHGSGMSDEAIVSALSEVWERAVYG